MKKVIKESILGGPVKPNIKVELKNKLNNNGGQRQIPVIDGPINNPEYGKNMSRSKSDLNPKPKIDLDAISKYTDNNRREVTMKDFTPEIKKDKIEVKDKVEKKPLTTREKFNKKFIKKDKGVGFVRRGSAVAQRAENKESARLRAQAMAKARIEAKKKAAAEEAKKSNVKEYYDAYDMVLEYLLSTEQAATIEEANYVMMQLDEENIQEIVGTVAKGLKAVGKFGAKSPLHFAALAGTTAALSPTAAKLAYKAKETVGNIANTITNFDPIGDARKKNIEDKQKKYREKSGTTKDDGYFYDPTIDKKG